MEPIKYVLKVRTFYRDLTFDTTAEEISSSVPSSVYPSKITLYQNKTDYVLQLNNEIYTLDDSELHKRPDMQNDTASVSIIGNRDNTTFEVTDITFEPNSAIGSTGYIVRINGNKQITSTLGITKYLIRFYTSDGILICSGRFDITIVSASANPIVTKTIDLDIRPMDILPIIHISQGSMDVKVLAKIMFNDCAFDKIHHLKEGRIVSEDSSVYKSRIEIEAIRPDGQEINLSSSLTISTDQFGRRVIQVPFNLTNDFTDVPGKTIAQIRIWYGYSIKNVTTGVTTYVIYSELYSSKFIIDVEKKP